MPPNATQMTTDEHHEPVEPQGPSLPEPTFKTEPAAPEARPNEKIGGFAFFLSLSVLLPLGLVLLFLTLSHVPMDGEALAIFFGAWVAGVVACQVFIRGHVSVLIHESKHAIVSNLVGNKRKGMKIGEHSGHFVYAYSKRTAHMNALISLAPYILPVFTLVGMLAAAAALRKDHAMAVLLVGICYGVDTALNVRDISPIQTDINEIRGGYGVGLLYIFAWNLAIFGVLLAWVFSGLTGLGILLEQITASFVHAYLLATGAS